MEQNIQSNENSMEIKLDSEGEPISPKSEKKINKKIISLIIVVLAIIGFGAIYFLFLDKEDDSQLPIDNDTTVLESEKEVEIDKQLDTDQDGFPDYLEKIIGTDENNSDTDGDSYDDYNEVKNGYNPLNDKKYTEEEWGVIKEMIRSEDEKLFGEMFSSSDEDPGWKKYLNNKYEYEIKYPSEWKGFYENEQADSVLFMERETSIEDLKQAILENKGFLIYRYENISPTVEKWSGAQNDRALSLQKVNIQISGITPTVYKEKLTEIIYYVVSRNNDVYVIMSSMDEEMMFQVLSTFKFIEKDETEPGEV